MTFTLMPASFTATVFFDQNGTLKILAFLSTVTASYEIPVRQASALPTATFRFHLAVDTLAVRLTVPLIGPVVDLHHQVIRPPPCEIGTVPNRYNAPCLAHKINSAVNEVTALPGSHNRLNPMRASLKPQYLTGTGPHDGELPP